MSKAFTRESDDAPERVGPVPKLSPLPPGAKNHMTPDGAARFRDELDRLVREERPGLVAAAEGSAERQRLALVDRRIQELRHCLETAVVAPVPDAAEGRVRFGATVTVRNGAGERECYRIVGVHETDFDRGWISWVSPLAKALLNARLGDRVRFKCPSGEEELVILEIG